MTADVGPDSAMLRSIVPVLISTLLWACTDQKADSGLAEASPNELRRTSATVEPDGVSYLYEYSRPDTIHPTTVEVLDVDGSRLLIQETELDSDGFRVHTEVRNDEGELRTLQDHRHDPSSTLLVSQVEYFTPASGPDEHVGEPVIDVTFEYDDAGRMIAAEASTWGIEDGVYYLRADVRVVYPLKDYALRGTFDGDYYRFYERGIWFNSDGDVTDEYETIFDADGFPEVSVLRSGGDVQQDHYVMEFDSSGVPTALVTGCARAGCPDGGTLREELDFEDGLLAAARGLRRGEEGSGDFEPSGAKLYQWTRHPLGGPSGGVLTTILVDGNGDVREEYDEVSWTETEFVRRGLDADGTRGQVYSAKLEPVTVAHD